MNEYYFIGNMARPREFGIVRRLGVPNGPCPFDVYRLDNLEFVAELRRDRDGRTDGLDGGRAPWKWNNSPKAELWRAGRFLVATFLPFPALDWQFIAEIYEERDFRRREKRNLFAAAGIVGKDSLKMVIKRRFLVSDEVADLELSVLGI